MNVHDFVKELLKVWISCKGSWFVINKIENLGDLAKAFYDTKDFDWILKNIRLTDISYDELVAIANEALQEKHREMDSILSGGKA